MHNLGPVDRIPLGEGRAFQVGDRQVAVFRLRDGRVLATQAHCPHQGGPLADGIVGGGSVLCPLHGRRFDLGSCADLATYPVELDRQGNVLVKT
jgi:nitrite reductase (NADH) small subunit